MSLLMKHAASVVDEDAQSQLTGSDAESIPSASARPNGSGTIRCVERASDIPFKLSEALDGNWAFAVGDEVEFSVVPVS